MTIGKESLRVVYKLPQRQSSTRTNVACTEKTKRKCQKPFRHDAATLILCDYFASYADDRTAV